jgi:anti-anti-sigma factor
MLTGARTPSFTVEAALDGAAARVVLRGEFDLTAVSALEEMLALVLGKAPDDIVLQMGEVAFIDCACIRVIAQAAQALPGPGRLVVQNLSPVARRLFQLTGLDAVATVGEPATAVLTAAVADAHDG